MRTSWCIELDLTTRTWSWRDCDETGIVIRQSDGTFVLFMDAFDDAKLHGCTGMPNYALPQQPA